MAVGFGDYLIRKWVVMRMAAQEFGFKQPFDVKEESPILKSILVLGLFPIEIVFVFWYARLYGSLASYRFPLIIVLALLNILVANLIVNRAKRKSVVDDAMAYYSELDCAERKKLYSFWNVTYVIFLSAILPWLICALAITIICIAVPR